MKPGLVLLPGMMCDARLFTPQIKHFGKGFEIHVAALSGADSLEAMVAAALARVPFQRFSLAGLSMGGIAAMEMMAQAPERIRRLAILDSNHLADPPERRSIRQRQIADVEAGKLRQVIIEEMKPHYLAEASRHDSALLELLIEMAIDLGHRVFVEQSLALMTRRDYSDALAAWKKPLLLLCGEEDALCPPERHRAMAVLCAQAELQIIAGAGHISTLEQPEEVNRLMDRFLAQD